MDTKRARRTVSEQKFWGASEANAIEELRTQLTAARARVEELEHKVKLLEEFAELQINGNVQTIHRLKLAIQDVLYCQSLPKHHRRNLEKALDQ